MDLPNPIQHVTESVEAVLNSVRYLRAWIICRITHCIYTPFCVVSRTKTKWGSTAFHRTHVCERCGRPKTVSSHKYSAFRHKADISWDHYTTPDSFSGRK